MSKKILIDASYPDNTQVAVMDNNRLVDLESSTNSKKMIKGNIYLAKVTRVEPSLQAAFIDYGGEKNGFIPFAEIHSDYYNVPSKYRDDSESDDENVSEEENIAVREELEGKYHELDGDDLDAVVDEAVTDNDPGIDPVVEEEDIENIKKKNVEKYKIQEVLKRNQILLVQAAKEERGNKGAAFTTYISLAGRCCVIMPNSGSKGGVSKKIEDSEERKRLKVVVDEISSTNPVGVIIRTVGQGRSKERIENDYNYLVKLWNFIREKTLISNAPAFIHSEENIFKRVIRDLYDNSVEGIWVEGKEAYQEIKEIVNSMSSEDELNIVQYTEKAPIFNKHKVDEQILNLYNPVAYTESGAYIVINPTEALIAIDVNSGRSTSEKNIERMALKTNLETAKEIVRQIRLRDLSGIIVIDFIDMMETRNKRLVEKTFKDLLYKDRAKVQVGHISSLGLLEVSRQRLKPNFLEANTVICTHCHGKGVVRSNNSNAITILKTVEGEISNNIVRVNVFASPETVLFMLNEKRDAIKKVEEKHSIKIFFNQDYKMSADGFAIEVIEENVRQNYKNPNKPQSGHSSNKNRRNNRGNEYRKDKKQVDQQSKPTSDKGSMDQKDSVDKKDDESVIAQKPAKKNNRRNSKKKDEKAKESVVLNEVGE
jgi:ribonuclease E